MRYDAPNNPPAFPCQFRTIGRYGTEEYERQEGMDLRDYFAAKAMQGLLSQIYSAEDIAKEAYGIADAMLKAREI